MRGSHRVAVLGIALAMLSAGCYRTRPSAVSDLSPQPRARLTASHLDTLVLGDVEVMRRIAVAPPPQPI